jgi:putative tryptophan/tyrosine transport system substrate-binding protein
MRRREFIKLIAGAAAWPLAASAQRSALPLVGYLDSTTAAARVNRVLGLRQGLSETGFAEGHNVAIEFRWAEDEPDRLPAMAADLVRRQVVVMVVSGPALAAAKAATSTIPIIFVTGADPVEDGYVTSLNRPGNNVTGASFNSGPLEPKRLELLHELIPKPAIIAALMDPNVVQSEIKLRAVEAAARALGRQILAVRAANEREFEPGFATIVQAGARALFIGSGPLYFNKHRQLVALADRHQLPANYGWRQPVEAGGLMSYGASDTDACRRAGHFVGRILKGARPSDLPVELPTKYELVINLRTARKLKLEIPPRLRALADEVIE